MTINLLLRYTLLSLIFISSNLNAQNRDIQRANKLFNLKNYSEAINFFEKAIDIDIVDERRLLICYQKQHNIVDAEYTHKIINENSNSNEEDILNYAKFFIKQKKNKKAQIWLQKYLISKPHDLEVIDLLKSCKIAEEIEQESLYEINEISINSSQSDFASAFYKDGIIFLSGRKNKTSKIINKETGDYYLDLYYSKKTKKGYNDPIPFSKIFNTKYNEGSACFTPNEKFIFFTRNKNTADLEGRVQLNIYTSRFNGKHWDKPELFEFSDHYFSMGQPSISKNGMYLYFISNMDGGYGGTDIYMCKKQGFTWSHPINMGPEINTSGNEMFPFYANDGYLYFSSDTHIGNGGLDIFKSRFEKNKWTHPVNLGKPFNSSYDDFSFFINENQSLGYFSSNRNEKQGDNIFEFYPKKNKLSSLKGLIRTVGSKEKLENVEVMLMEYNSIQATTKTAEDGTFEFNLFPNKNYSFVIRKVGYKTKRILYNGKTDKQLNIMIEKKDWINFSGFITASSNNKNLTGVSIQVINQTYGVNSHKINNEDGTFSFKLEKDKPYELIISKTGYFTKLIETFRHDSNNVTKISLQKIAKNQTMKLEDCIFNKDETFLNPIVRENLDNIAGLLINNPHINIEIGAYTNSNNGKKHNKELCLTRAKNAAAYIHNKGIAINRVKYNSYGFNKKQSHLVIKVTESF